MSDWRKNGGAPQALPFRDIDADNNMWTDLANNEEGRAACGWTEAPAMPDYDPATQDIAWVDGAWVVTDRPPPPVTLPSEVPMWKVMRVLITRGEDDDLQAYLEAIPGAQGKIIRSDFARAPNLVVASPFADAAKAAMGWSDDDYADRILQADAITG